MRTIICVCPRCGRPYNYIKKRKINGRVYLYAVHYFRDDSDRRKMSECYLGPKDHYEYVSRLHEEKGLILKGLVEQEGLLEYLDAIVDYITSSNVDRELIRNMLEKLEEAVQKLRKILAE